MRNDRKNLLFMTLYGFDAQLWLQCQKIVYPGRMASLNPPFNEPNMGPKKKPASWLYHLLLNNPKLRKQVLYGN